MSQEINIIPEGWNPLSTTPPDKLVEVIDTDGNTAFAQPTYFPFEVVKKPGDERKPWGWRGTPVFYEDEVSRWDGNWLVGMEGITCSNIGTIIGWKNK